MVSHVTDSAQNSGETSLQLGDVLLVGLGASTLAAARYLLPLVGGRVASLTAYAGKESPTTRERADELAAQGVRVVMDSESVEGHFDLGIVSPGIPQVGAFYRSAHDACDELISEPELAWRESPRDWVGITGTNGKTTTTTLTARLLAASGVPARTVGNIGLPPIACVANREPGEVFVAELSSFQLASTRLLHPRVGVLLNVTPDHVEWHGTLEAYAQAKERLFANMDAGDLCVVGDDERCQALARHLEECGLRVCRIATAGEPDSTTACAAWIDREGMLCVRLDGTDHVLARFADMHLKGAHNAQNALAAAASALEMGASDTAVTSELLAFEPLEHRIEPCGTSKAGISFFDDSKGTNVDATEKAIASFEAGRLVLLVGGHDKGTDLSSLAQLCAQTCRAVVAYGEAGPRFARELGAAGCRVQEVPHMREALEAAVALAQPGDAVLLSPACSSFDEFPNYVERGRVFKSLVADMLALEEQA